MIAASQVSASRSPFGNGEPREYPRPRVFVSSANPPFFVPADLYDLQRNLGGCIADRISHAEIRSVVELYVSLPKDANERRRLSRSAPVLQEGAI
jgi:hypothetical protein